MIEITSKVKLEFWPQEYISIYQTTDYSSGTPGQKYVVNFDQELVNDLRWLKEYRKQLDKEIKLRAENPALSSQYEAYQAMLKLVNEEEKTP